MRRFAILNSVIREKEKSLSDFNLLPKKEVHPHKSSLFHTLLTEDETFAEVCRRSKPLVLVEGNWGRKLRISGHALVLKNELSSGFDISCLGGERRRRRRNSWGDEDTKDERERKSHESHEREINSAYANMLVKSDRWQEIMERWWIDSQKEEERISQGMVSGKDWREERRNRVDR